MLTDISASCRQLRAELGSTPIAPIEPQGVIVLRRVASGIREHWDVRFSEWLMVYPAVGMGAALVLQPKMFSISPSFAKIAQWGDEGFWATMVLLCACVRLVALVVNGTFRDFRWSPHMRMASSLVSLGFWSQFTLGFFSAVAAGGGSLSPLVAYSTFCVAELVNFHRSSKDLGRPGRPGQKR